MSNAVSSWLVVVVPRGYEKDYCRYLAANGVASFLPSQLLPDGGSAVALPGLCFVQASVAQVEALKDREGSMRSRFFVDAVTRLPLEVTDGEMENFKLLFKPKLRLTFLDARRRDAKSGPRVRVVSGPFEGLVGEYVRVRGNRCVVVHLRTVAAVATPFVEPSSVQPIDG